MNHPKMRATPELAVAINYLENATNGFHYEMYCLLNKYLFNPKPDQIIPELEAIRHDNQFHVVDSIRYGYEVF